MLVQHFLESSACNSPDKIALVCGNRRLTYGEIDLLANRLAHSLRAEGIERGDRVAVYLENSIEAVVSIFAILKAAGVFVVVHPTVKMKKLEIILNDCGAKGMITDVPKARVLNAAASPLPYLRSVWITGTYENDSQLYRCVSMDRVFAESRANDAPRDSCIDMDLAALIYTSGSTGRPKGVMLTHLNLVSAASSIGTYLENTPADTILSVLPLSYGYGLSQILTGFKAGASVILERSFTYPHELLQTIIREKVTGLPMVPTMAAILLCTDLGRYQLPSLRYITNAGAALPTARVRELRACWPHVKLYCMYGQTECIRVTFLPPEQADTRPASVGRGMPNEEVYLVDELGQRAAGAGFGELVVRGSNVMKGYWGLPEETSKALRPGLYPGESVLHTGDLFRTDSEGYLYFVARQDDIIKTRGEKVSPKEVEEVLSGIEGVAEAVVVGVPDPILGEAIKAALILRPGYVLSVQKVRRYCASHLEDFMVPKYVEFRDSLPHTSNGKIARQALANGLMEHA